MLEILILILLIFLVITAFIKCICLCNRNKIEYPLVKGAGGGNYSLKQLGITSGFFLIVYDKQTNAFLAAFLKIGKLSLELPFPLQGSSSSSSAYSPSLPSSPSSPFLSPSLPSSPSSPSLSTTTTTSSSNTDIEDDYEDDYEDIQDQLDEYFNKLLYMRHDPNIIKYTRYLRSYKEAIGDIQYIPTFGENLRNSKRYKYKIIPLFAILHNTMLSCFYEFAFHMLLMNDLMADQNTNHSIRCISDAHIMKFIANECKKPEGANWKEYIFKHSENARNFSDIATSCEFWNIECDGTFAKLHNVYIHVRSILEELLGMDHRTLNLPASDKSTCPDNTLIQRIITLFPRLSVITQTSPAFLTTSTVQQPPLQFPSFIPSVPLPQSSTPSLSLGQLNQTTSSSMSSFQSSTMNSMLQIDSLVELQQLINDTDFYANMPVNDMGIINNHLIFIDKYNISGSIPETVPYRRCVYSDLKKYKDTMVVPFFAESFAHGLVTIENKILHGTKSEIESLIEYIMGYQLKKMKSNDSMIHVNDITYFENTYGMVKPNVDDKNNHTPTVSDALYFSFLAPIISDFHELIAQRKPNIQSKRLNPPLAPPTYLEQVNFNFLDNPSRSIVTDRALRNDGDKERIITEIEKIKSSGMSPTNKISYIVQVITNFINNYFFSYELNEIRDHINGIINLGKDTIQDMYDLLDELLFKSGQAYQVPQRRTFSYEDGPLMSPSYTPSNFAFKFIYEMKRTMPKNSVNPISSITHIYKMCTSHKPTRDLDKDDLIYICNEINYYINPKININKVQNWNNIIRELYIIGLDNGIHLKQDNMATSSISPSTIPSMQQSSSSATQDPILKKMMDELRSLPMAQLADENVVNIIKILGKYDRNMVIPPYQMGEITSIISKYLPNLTLPPGINRLLDLYLAMTGYAATIPSIA